MYAYPDLTVYCGEPELAPTRPESLLNPRLIVEVLSESTAAYDISAKAAHYRNRPSVLQILFVDSRRRLVQSQTRNADGTWTLRDQDAGDVSIGPLGLTIPMDELYEGVTFETA
jgi:Uma2 family endonuclease